MLASHAVFLIHFVIELVLDIYIIDFIINIGLLHYQELQDVSFVVIEQSDDAPRDQLHDSILVFGQAPHDTRYRTLITHASECSDSDFQVIRILLFKSNFQGGHLCEPADFDAIRVLALAAGFERHFDVDQRLTIREPKTAVVGQFFIVSHAKVHVLDIIIVHIQSYLLKTQFLYLDFFLKFFHFRQDVIKKVLR